MSNLPIYPHLGMTEAELENICKELFDVDTVLAGHAQRITEYEAKLADYEERTQKFLTDIRAMEAREDELNAALKAVTREKRETHGLVAGLKYHTKVAERRVQEAKRSIERRKKQLYLAEAKRRLGELGKELKLGGRGFRKGPTVVIDKQSA